MSLPAGVAHQVDTVPPNGAAVTADAGQRVRRPVRRLVVSYAIAVFVLVTVNFFLPRAMPGDPLSILENVGSPTYVRDDATRVALSRYYGLDRSLPQQYLHYLGGLVRGDLGVSIRSRVPVTQRIGESLPWTLLLVTSALGLATVVGWAAGVHSGWRRGRRIDRGLLGLFIAVRNFPVFFVASLALFVFAVKLRWFPLTGATTPFSSLGSLARLLDVVHHLVLPASVLALQFSAVSDLVMRGSMVGELGSDYLVLGRAKGLSDRSLKYRYAARNALLPVVTLTGAQVGLAVSASVLVETVFAYPGMGRLMFQSVTFHDYPTLQGAFLLLTLLVLGTSFAVECLYRWLDPRTEA